MTKPRLPPLTNLSMNETINIPLAAAKKIFLIKLKNQDLAMKVLIPN